ncbi:hypothetical protein C1H46_015498 [Malus baccata]|uniref:RNase H type-1 domain-containing protein n=1 Tax=Malus baccata TaxID=106549 RepID=A0A540MJ98_MALBA|nr:hypothetical protein C1H46_015498 [Malus baccata]
MIPTDGWFKLNVDGAVKVGEGIGGVGRRFVKVTVVSVLLVQGSFSVKQVELLALREGLHLAQRVGCRFLRVESDSMEVVLACNGTSVDYSSLRYIVFYIKEFASEFDRCTFLYMPRTCNDATHRLAKLSLVIQLYGLRNPKMLLGMTSVMICTRVEF